MQGQGLIGLGMRMLQGGKDKTGFGDLYDSLGVTRERSQDPAKLLAAALASMEMGDDEITNDRETVEDKITGGDSEFSFNDIFDSAKDYVDDNPLTTGINTATGLGLFGLIPKTTRGVANKALNFLLPIETGIANVNEQVGNIEELENDPTVDPEFTEFYEDNVLSGGTGLAGGRYSKGITLGNTIKNLFGFEDGGRVEMQQGGMPMAGQQPMGSVAELLTMAGQQPMGPTFRTADFRDYNNDGVDDRDQPVNPPTGNELPIGPRPPLLGDPGFDPTLPPDYQGPSYDFFSQFRTMGPAYGAPMQPQTFQQPSEPFQFGMDIGDYLGGPDPFAVSYNPYVNATGTEDAYEQYGLNMSEDEIMDAFSDLDKYSLAAQEAKRKAAEEAAKKAAQKNKPKGGGGGNQNNNNNNTTSGNEVGAAGSEDDRGAGFGGYGGGADSGSGGVGTSGGPGGGNFGGHGHGLA